MQIASRKTGATKDAGMQRIQRLDQRRELFTACEESTRRRCTSGVRRETEVVSRGEKGISFTGENEGTKRWKSCKRLTQTLTRGQKAGTGVQETTSPTTGRGGGRGGGGGMPHVLV